MARAQGADDCKPRLLACAKMFADEKKEHSRNGANRFAKSRMTRARARQNAATNLNEENSHKTTKSVNKWRRERGAAQNVASERHIELRALYKYFLLYKVCPTFSISEIRNLRRGRSFIDARSKSATYFCVSNSQKRRETMRTQCSGSMRLQNERNDELSGNDCGAQIYERWPTSS